MKKNMAWTTPVGTRQSKAPDPGSERRRKGRRITEEKGESFVSLLNPPTRWTGFITNEYSVDVGTYACECVYLCGSWSMEDGQNWEDRIASLGRDSWLDSFGTDFLVLFPKTRGVTGTNVMDRFNGTLTYSSTWDLRSHLARTRWKILQYLMFQNYEERAENVVLALLWKTPFELQIYFYK